jgi:hypothetical protein
MRVSSQGVPTYEWHCGSDRNSTIAIRLADILDRSAKGAMAEENTVKPVRSALISNQFRGRSRIESAYSTFNILLAYILFGSTTCSSQEKDAFALI